jgi:nicotinate-nucleotide adenylyltransferase
MRLGILGGSFDPVHFGHLALARACQRRAGLDAVWFTPAAIQPLKHAGPHASDEQRVEMLGLVIEGQPGWRVCTLEIERGGFSYTVDTLRQLHTEQPNDELFLIVGSDVLAEVPYWKEPGEIFHLATPLVVARAGDQPPDVSILLPFCGQKTRPQLVEMEPWDVSSSDIRRRVLAGERIDALVPPAVASYIQTQRVYG